MNTTAFESLRTYAHNHAVPIISQNTEVFLKKYIIDHNIKHIVEIGSAIGYSTSVLIDAIKENHHHGWTILSREISYPHYYQSVIHTRQYHWAKIVLWNFCNYPLHKFLQPWQYDMVFIDGRKSETLDYLTRLAPYLQTTTHIIIDDAIKFKSKMQDCYDFLDKNHISYTIEQLDTDDGILIIPQSWRLIQALYDL